MIQMLRLENVRKSFGAIEALDDVSLSVDKGSINGLIGPNGAGKTVLFNVITGRYKPDSGHIYFKDTDVTSKPTYERARMGIARGFQELRLFPEQSVIENLMIAAQPKPIRHNIKTVFSNRQSDDIREQAEAILTELEIHDKKDITAGEMSFGQQKLVQFGMLLMVEPELIMLDEIMAGVNPNLTERMKEYVREYNDRGTTFLIVEHDVPSIMELCDQVTVLNSGRRLTTGTPAEIRENEEVIEAYLG
jgi:branched-chain amino acid transport system ATP-binding protein